MSIKLHCVSFKRHNNSQCDNSTNETKAEEDKLLNPLNLIMISPSFLLLFEKQQTSLPGTRRLRTENALGGSGSADIVQIRLIR